MTEEKIERTVERRMDMFDRHLRLHNITQEQYDQLVIDLDIWAKAEYANLIREGA